MKLSQLSITKLHDLYDYEVHFNPDLTFLYGSNGSGKTTILNILQSIISGNLYKLFEYKFKRLELLYNKDDFDDNNKSIVVEQKGNSIELLYNGANYSISRRDAALIDERSELGMISHERNIKLNTHMKVFQAIKYEFNSVYLPLNRSFREYDQLSKDSRDISNNITYTLHNYLRQNDETASAHNDNDIAIQQIEDIIKNNTNKINRLTSNASDQFRNDILSFAVTIRESNSVPDAITQLLDQANRNAMLTEFDSIQKNYLQLLKSLSLLSKSSESKYNEYFSSIKMRLKESKSKNEETEIKLDLLMQYIEIMRLKQIVQASNDFEEKKATIKKPLVDLLKIVNSFFNQNEDIKTLQIDSDGSVSFITQDHNTPISIQFLSSGEKQLLIFFTHLIFSIKSDEHGIFIADEPEISLHIMWQRSFVEQLHLVRPNIQLIFATHSPEIIHENHDKMIKLDKKQNR